jgi:hypothetical protein
VADRERVLALLQKLEAESTRKLALGTVRVAQRIEQELGRDAA